MAVYTTIDDPSLYFRVKAYEGNASNDHAITWDETHANMQPDLLWFKSRDNAQSHALWDSVRGASLRLIPNSSGGEGTEATNLDSFDSNGFQVDNEAIVNHDSMVAWGWKESATAGFDIVSYTGNGSNRTISHSLSATPDLVITKRRDTTGDWMIGGSTTLGGDNKLLLLNTTAALDDNSEVYQSFSSSTFGIGVNAYINTNTSTYISYLFSGKQGWSKFSNYVGNGNADGTFVYTGFRPAMVIIKRSSDTEYWGILDNKRNTYNPANLYLAPNRFDADTTYTVLDFTANGFKHRSTGSMFNTSGSTYIYAAFAEAPFVNSKGVPCNAR